MSLKPMLPAALRPQDDHVLVFPVVACPVPRGHRVFVTESKVRHLDGMPVANRQIQNMFGQPHCEGLDGVLILGDPASPAAYPRTRAMLDDPAMTDAQVQFAVWDCWSDVRLPFNHRFYMANEAVLKTPMSQVVPHQLLPQRAAFAAYCDSAISLGYRQLVLRNPNSLYVPGEVKLQTGAMLLYKLQ